MDASGDLVGLAEEIEDPVANRPQLLEFGFDGGLGLGGRQRVSRNAGCVGSELTKVGGGLAGGGSSSRLDLRGNGSARLPGTLTPF